MTDYTFSTVDVQDGLTTPQNINNNGEVVGNYLDENDNENGFSELNGVYTTIDVPNAVATGALGINSAGVIVGEYFDDEDTGHGFIDDNGTFTTLDFAADFDTTLEQINNSGEIVGYTSAPSGGGGSYLYSNGKITPIVNSAFPDLVVTGISNSGEIVGQYSDPTTGQQRGFIDNNGAFTTIDPPGSTFTSVFGINASGQVSGYYIDANGIQHGFATTDGVFSNVDDPSGPSAALGLNDLGQVVGITRDDAGDQVGFVATPACYATGTRIATTRGEIAVEDLRVGDRAVTASGAERPIVWIGHQSLALLRHARQSALMPVRIEAGAFGDQLPVRDLWLSPKHTVFIDGLLIPIDVLINGTTIRQVACERITYWHVELESHDILLAEGLPAESFLECENRAAFETDANAVALHPSVDPKDRSGACAPFREFGPEVVAVRTRLMARAEAKQGSAGRNARAA